MDYCQSLLSSLERCRKLELELKFEEVLIELDQFEADLQTLVAIEQNYTGKMKASKGQKKLSAAEKEMLKSFKNK